MTPEISEFSYGFALTNELVGWTELSAAPVFPNLIEEGKLGGGYDVKLDAPGAPLYLQFKRADCLTRRSARELRHYGLPLEVPFHRFAITERSRSFQHTSLVSLDAGENMVFYAAPRFHTLDGINAAWAANNVAAESIFISPAEIGEIDDDAAHHVSYDDHSAFLCSEPRTIQARSGADIRRAFEAKLDKEKRPVRQRLPEWLGGIQEARRRAENRQFSIEALIAERRREKLSAQPGTFEGARLGGIEEPNDALRMAGFLDQPPRLPPPLREPLPVRQPRPLTEDERQLRDLADIARREFNVLLCVLQRP